MTRVSTASNLTVRVERKLRKALQQRADAHGRSVSAMVRLLLAYALAAPDGEDGMRLLIERWERELRGGDD